jgi:hypothetical protein
MVPLALPGHLAQMECLGQLVTQAKRESKVPYLCVCVCGWVFVWVFVCVCVCVCVCVLCVCVCELV